MPDELDRMVSEDRSGKDRRDDDSGRDRIAAIARRFAQIARDLDQRYKRVSHFLLGSMIVFLVFAGYTYYEQRRLEEEQRAARWRAVYSACLERNKTNDGIVNYLAVEAGASPRVLARAREFFPNEPDCETYTRTLLAQREPDHAFDLPPILRQHAYPTATPSPSRK